MSSCPTGTYPWVRSAHYQGQGHNESLRDPPLWAEIWCEGLFYSESEKQYSPSVHKVAYLIQHSVVINDLLFSECLLLVMNWHTLKEKMTTCLYGHFWSFSIDIFKQNEIAWLIMTCPLVCLSLQNYPQGWQIVNIMQYHSPSSRPVSVFCRHSPFLEMFKVF